MKSMVFNRKFSQIRLFLSLYHKNKSPNRKNAKIDFIKEAKNIYTIDMYINTNKLIN